MNLEETPLNAQNRQHVLRTLRHMWLLVEDEMHHDTLSRPFKTRVFDAEQKRITNIFAATMKRQLYELLRPIRRTEALHEPLSDSSQLRKNDSR